MRYQLLFSVVTLLASIDVAFADDATTISSIGCVAPSDFDSCLNDAAQSESQCVQETSGNTTETRACGLALYTNQMECYFESCWNKVYSCEYQSLVVEYQSDRGLVEPENVPFWPAPDDAPGGCSCNLGNLYVNASGSLTEPTCLSILDTTEAAECDCCSFSAALAAYYGICPTTDPSQLGPLYIQEVTGFESDVNIKCSDLLASTNCETQYGIGTAYDNKYPDPADGLPANGTEPLSTTTGSLTSPPGGATFTWSLLGLVRTAIAAPYNEKNVQATTSDGTAATSAKTGGTTATSTTSGGAAVTSGTSKSTSTKATSTDSSQSGTSSAAATSAVKTSRAVRGQSLAGRIHTLFVLLIVTAYVS